MPRAPPSTQPRPRSSRSDALARSAPRPQPRRALYKFPGVCPSPGSTIPASPPFLPFITVYVLVGGRVRQRAVAVYFERRQYSSIRECHPERSWNIPVYENTLDWLILANSIEVPVKSFTRVSAVLTSFDPAEPQMRTDDLLARAGIPKSSGYKLVSDLIAEGLLKREARGFVALGPSAMELLYSPLKANMPLREAYGSPNIRQPGSTPRKSHFESDLLELVRTERYRKFPPFTIGFANASTSHPWRLAMERSLRAAAQRHAGIVARLIVSDAQNDPERQAGQLSDMQRAGVDICILSAAVEHHHVLEESVEQLVQQQIPVVGVDRICGVGRHRR
ncbi:MAG: hypothetical protein EPN45_00300, partial [Rhizobiaceae bacterium]